MLMVERIELFILIDMGMPLTLSFLITVCSKEMNLKSFKTKSCKNCVILNIYGLLEATSAAF